MIKTETAYKKALKKLQEDETFVHNQKSSLEEKGLTNEQITKALEPTISFHEQLKEEVASYEHIIRGEFNTIINLHDIGKMLIAYRIYLGISQQDLAKRLETTPAQVSRDERNEYYGATIERLQQVMDAMSMVSETRIKSVL